MALRERCYGITGLLSWHYVTVDIASREYWRDAEYSNALSGLMRSYLNSTMLGNIALPNL